LNWPETAENCVSWVVCEEKQRSASSRGTGTSAFPNRGEEKKKSRGVHNESDYTSIFTRVFFSLPLKKLLPKTEARERRAHETTTDLHPASMNAYRGSERSHF